MTDMHRSAEFSPCRTWRYALHRRWDESLPTLAVIGLNPSTADETQDDPTIRRIMGFARSWGFGGIAMLNLFAFRATDPKDMKAARDPVGLDNDRAIMLHTEDRCVLCCWGAHGQHKGRAARVLSNLERHACRPFHLGRTKAGHPKHPLYLRSDTQPMWFSGEPADMARVLGVES